MQGVTWAAEDGGCNLHIMDREKMRHSAGLAHFCLSLWTVRPETSVAYLI